MKLETHDLIEAESRAQRMLDGMSVNREVLAREHIKMAQEIRRWREAFNNAESKRKDTSPFGDAFKGVWG